jgi:hypothetical protein
MRQRFLKEFDTLWFDCLNGDSRETGKLTPEGKPDPSVFSTETNRGRTTDFFDYAASARLSLRAA